MTDNPNTEELQIITAESQERDNTPNDPAALAALIPRN